ncbi:MAG TPA: CBS domain-containing protein [Coriobacteriia bacterium]|nr:CBS domain-containing protein [Coriobacteriia bacterium]
MRVVVGHANPDFDAYASTVAATKLFPGSRGVFLGSQNANVRAFHNLHEEFLDFVDLKGLDLDAIESIVMVDTRDPGRIGELGEVALRPGVEVIVYDHHPAQEGDIEGADDRSCDAGSTTSILVHEIEERAIELAPLEASLLLLGIHEDTGSLTYPGTTAYDAEAAAYLMEVGADLEVLNNFLARSLDPAQRALLDQLASTLEVWDINGQQVAVGTAVADEYVDSASVLTHYIVEDMGFKVAVAVVDMPERMQVVARSRIAEIDVGAVMADLGGGGHAQAASAGFRAGDVAEVLARVRESLGRHVPPPMRACDLMSAPVRTVEPEATMAEAGELMSRWGHGGLPVVEGDQLVGLVTRKDVDKALRHGLGHAPVTGFMTHDVVTVEPSVDMYSLERLLATRGIGRVPVVERGAVTGIVTRKDVLRAEHGDAYLDRRLAIAHPEASQRFSEAVEQLLPEYASAALHVLGEVSATLDRRAHVVGGFVRDMLLGRPNLDIDLVVEGDGVSFAEEAARVMGARAKVHHRFGTAVIVVSRDFHIDVASSRSEYYVRPGALPTVERSSLRQDLFRRDFTINAMAACIQPECFGQLADPFGGLGDLEKGRVRVLHGLSFVDDPTRLLRAARFEVRYGFAMDAGTEGQARRAVEMKLLDEVSGARIREELLDIIDEADPVAVLSRLGEIGALEYLLPEGAKVKAAVKDARAVQDALADFKRFEKVRAERRIAFVTSMAWSDSVPATERWIHRFRFGKAYSIVATTLAQRGSAALRALQDKRGMRDSRLFHALDALPPEALVVLWARANERGRARIDRFLGELAQTKPAVSGTDLIEMGYRPSETFTAILARARDDRLDGRCVGRDAELLNLRRIALRTLGHPSTKAD